MTKAAPPVRWAQHFRAVRGQLAGLVVEVYDARG